MLSASRENKLLDKETRSLGRPGTLEDDRSHSAGIQGTPASNPITTDPSRSEQYELSMFFMLLGGSTSHNCDNTRMLAFADSDHARSCL